MNTTFSVQWDDEAEAYRIYDNDEEQPISYYAEEDDIEDEIEILRRKGYNVIVKGI